MTELTMLNVGHGQCIVLKATNGNVMVFDCGWGADSTDRPYTHLRSVAPTGIELFVNTNFDQDHVADLPTVKSLGIRTFYRNKSMPPNALRRIKQEGGGVTRAMQALIDMMESYNGDAAPPPQFDSFQYQFFQAKFPDDFEDTNNLSVATIVRSAACSLLVPGDLEAPGWEKLLQDPAFRAALKNVGVLVASHHGRESGYYEDLFRNCKPHVILISDEPKQFDTQETTAKYAAQATGIVYGGRTRQVLTTRSDGQVGLTF